MRCPNCNSDGIRFTREGDYHCVDCGYRWKTVKVGWKMNGVSDKGKELGETHWKYIESLLIVHGEDEKTIQKIKFHYIQAMKHGYKHGINDKIGEEKMNEKPCPYCGASRKHKDDCKYILSIGNLALKEGLMDRDGDCSKGICPIKNGIILDGHKAICDNCYH